MQLRQSKLQSWSWELSLAAQSELGKEQQVPPQQHILINPPLGCQHCQQGLTTGQAVPQSKKDRSEVSEDRRSHKQVQGTGATKG